MESGGQLDELVAAVLDGTPVDWASLEANGDVPGWFLRHLKVVAGVAEVHRASEPGGAGPAPVASWGHLQLLERIGQGSFGEVYRAWDTRLDREVALKLLKSEHVSGRPAPSSIIEEGRLLARVHHPNVATINGAEQIDDRIGLWMEFVSGRTLEQLLQDGKSFSSAEATRIGFDLCRAVAAVHSAGLLHRDIKAHNVMLASDGRVVLMDFGSGRELANDSDGDVAGTPLYLAPEVLSGQPATVQSDVYSLGVLLFRLVSRSYPVQAQTTRDILLAHQRGEPVDLRAIAPGLSRSMARVVARAIDPCPARRYPSASALGADLERIERRPARRRLAFAAAAAVALVACLAWWALGREPGGAGPVRDPVIAVLPFANLDTAPDSEALVDGLTVELIQQLGVIEGLRVNSQGSSFTYKNQPRNLRDVAGQLGANLVVEGRVLRAGHTLRINASLVQIDGDVVLWAGGFDRTVASAGDVIGILDDIARAIVDKLRLTLGRGQRRYELIDLEAYELYLRARALIDRRGAPNARRAADLLQQAIEREASFAPAHAALANAHAFMSMPSGGESFTVAHPVMREAAVRALELDPLLADAHSAMGWVHAREFDWAGAEREFQRAIQLNPNLSQTYTSYSLSTLLPLGKDAEALRLLDIARRNDPLNLDIQREIGVVHLFSLRYAEAIETLQRVRDADPGFPFINLYLARALLFGGRARESIPLFELLDGRDSTLPRPGTSAPSRAPGRLWPHAAVMIGRRAEVEALAADERQRSPYRRAFIFAALGDRERTLENLQQMAVVEPQRLGFVLRAPELAEFRGDPRFIAFRKRFGLP
jgi:serine/threonine-protein kinase